MLYTNMKGPRQQLFTAAAALYLLTNKPYFRTEADTLWDPEFATYLYNWNNVPNLGLAILSLAPDLPSAKVNRNYYRNQMRNAVGYWSACNSEGSAAAKDGVFCKCDPRPSTALP
jgi:hypothetical protein